MASDTTSTSTSTSTSPSPSPSTSTTSASRTKLLYTGAEDDKVLKNVYKLTTSLLYDQPIYIQHKYIAALLGSRSYYDKAIVEYQKAIDTYVPDDTLFLAETCHERALLHARRGDVMEGIKWFTRAIDEVKKIKSEAAWNAEMKFTHNFAILYRTAGPSHFTQAITLYQHLITCYTTEPHIDYTLAADAAYAIAEIYNEMRRWSDARTYVEKCLTWRQQLATSYERGGIIDVNKRHRIHGDLCLAKCLAAATLGAPDVGEFDEAEKLANEAMKMIKNETKSFTEQSKSDEIAGVDHIIKNIKAARQRATQNTKINGKQNTTTKCCVCGLPSTSQCSRCKAVHYCSKEHQKLDWRVHKRVCAAVDNIQPSADASVAAITSSTTAKTVTATSIDTDTSISTSTSTSSATATAPS